MSEKKKRILHIVCAIVLVLGLVTFSLRGWIRGTLWLGYVRSHHQAAVSKQFEKNLASLNEILGQYHLNMSGAPVECTVTGYKFIQANYRCAGSARSSAMPDIDITVSFNERWERASSEVIEEQLEQQGWYQLSGPRSGVGGMLSGKESNLPLIYKQAGRPECTLTLQGQPETVKKFQLASSLYCERRVYFFGGYKSDH